MLDSVEARANHLRETVQNGRAIIVVGSGVSIGASVDPVTKKPHPEASWIGLLKNGLSWISEHRHVNDEHADVLAGVIKFSRTSRDLITVAEHITTNMASAHFKDWLEATIGSIRANCRDTLDSLQALRMRGNLLATTNYDSLLLDDKGLLQPLTWKSPTDMVRAIRHEDNDKILFLHGYWRDPNSVILDWNSYERVTRNQDYREDLAAFWKLKTWVYVGCGTDGLTDPDFGLLMERYGKRAREAGWWDFCLVRDDQREEFQEKFDELDANVYAVPFGPTHGHLAEYLGSLIEIAEPDPPDQTVAQDGGLADSRTFDFGSPPKFTSDARVVKSFVGRQTEVKQALSTVRGQKIGQKSRPGSGTSLYWYHGFGGMGKSWMLRHLAYKVSKSRSKTPPAVVLVDWNPYGERWSTLDAIPADPLAMFRGIAIRATQVCGDDSFDEFWTAFSSLEQQQETLLAYQSRFQAALSRLASNSDHSKPINEPGPDRVPITFTSPKTERDIESLRNAVREYGLRTGNDTSDTEGISVPSYDQDIVYEKWARQFLVSAHSSHEVVTRPYSYMVGLLQSGIERLSTVRPVFLLLDTCELLDERNERWLRRLLAPLLVDSAPIVVAISSRSRPDRFHSLGQRGGWREEFEGRLSSIPFDRDFFFTITDIQKLLSSNQVNLGGKDIDELAQRLQIVTRGLPLAVGLLIGHYPDLLKDVAELENLVEGELNNNKAAQTVIAEVCARWLSHIANPDDHDDLIALALLPGDHEPLKDPWPSPSRSSISVANWTSHNDDDHRFRERFLSALWGRSAWRNRIRILEQRYNLISDGDLHPLVRRFLVARWMKDPPDGLNAVIKRLVAKLEEIEPVDSYDQPWVSWIEHYVSLERWLDAPAAQERLARAFAVGRAHELNISALSRLMREFNLEPTIDVASQFSSERWTQLERSCLNLVAGMEKHELANSRDDKERTRLRESAAELLSSALEKVYSRLPGRQQVTVSEVYLECVTQLTFEGKRPELLERATQLAKTISLKQMGMWWAGLLHNQSRYEESNEVLRSIIHENPKDAFAVRILVHNLADHLDNKEEEALDVIEQCSDEDLGFDLRNRKVSLLSKLNRHREAIEVLERIFNDGFEIWGKPSQLLESQLLLASLYGQTGNHVSANTQLSKAITLCESHYASGDEEASKLLHSLAQNVGFAADSLRQHGKTTEAISFLETLLDHQSLCDELGCVDRLTLQIELGSAYWACKRKDEAWRHVNRAIDVCDSLLDSKSDEVAFSANNLAWNLYMMNQELEKAEELATRSLHARTDCLYTLHTLFAIQARTGNWDDVAPNFRRHAKNRPAEEVFGETWHQHILFFRDVAKAGKAVWTAALIRNELGELPEDRRYAALCFALAPSDNIPSQLQDLTRAITEQIYSDEEWPKFPKI